MKRLAKDVAALAAGGKRALADALASIETMAGSAGLAAPLDEAHARPRGGRKG